MTWKKVAVCTLAGLGLMMAAAWVAGYFYLSSNAFREFARRKIIAQANQATGGRTDIAGLTLNLATLTAQFHSVVLHGNEPPGAPPLFQVDDLTVRLRIRSILHREINLRELVIDHPVVHVDVDREGKSNIPQTQPNPSGTHLSVFDLAVEHLVLARGEVNYKDQTMPLSIDLHDLTTRVTFDFLARRCRGSVSYDNGHVEYGKYRPLPNGLNATFSATPSLFTLETAVMKLASSSITIRGQVADYSNPVVAGVYEIHAHTQDFAAMTPGINVAGDLSLKGAIRYQNGQPWLRRVAIDGQMDSEGVSAVSSGGHIELRKLHGTYHLANGVLNGSGIQAESLGGRIRAELAVRNVGSTPSFTVQAGLSSISLRAVQQAVRNPAYRGVSVSGTLDGTAVASWAGSVRDMRAHSDLTVHADKKVSSRSTTDIPIEGAIHGAYDARNQILTVHNTILGIPAASVTAEGQLSKKSHLELHATVSDLHQVIALATAFGSASAHAPLVSGSATLSANVQGPTQRPQISGTVSAKDLRVQGSAWKSSEFSVQANPLRLAVSNGSLISMQRGQASFSANIGLHDWSYAPGNPVQARISVRHMSVADLEHLANAQFPVGGELSGDFSLSGSQLDPTGSGSIEITKAQAYGEPIRNLSLNFHAQNGSIVSALSLAASAGSANASLTYIPKTRAYKLRLDVPAIVLQKLRAVEAHNMNVKGILTVSATGQGTLGDPQLTATMQMPRLELQEQSITAMKAELQVANKHAYVTLDSDVAKASVRARGEVNLTADYETDASIDTTMIPLDGLLAAYAKVVPRDFQGQTELHATIKGPLKDPARLEGHLTIPTLRATYQSLQIGIAAPIRADYEHSVVTLQPSEIRGTDTSIQVQGKFPLAGAATPTLTASGSIDARIFRIFDPDVRSSGTLNLDIRTSGSAASGGIQGQVRLHDISLSTEAAPVTVSKLNGTLDLAGARLQISNLSGEVGGGQISGGGSVTYRPGLQFDLALRGKSVRLRYPEGLRSLLDGDFTWVGNRQGSILMGRVLINELSFTPDFDLATFSDQFTGNVVAPAEPGLADTVKLQVTVQCKDNLSASSSQISLAGSANLRVSGTAADPVITGRTDLTSGELFYRSVRYQLQHGLISFSDPNQTKPVMDVSVTTTVEQYNLTLNLRGPLESLTTSYVSDPPLSTADIIHLIALGNTTQEAAASSQSTDSIIASQAAGQLSGSVQKLAGISSLQISPLLGGNNQDPSARLAVQQRVTKNFLFTFSTDVSQPGQEIVEGDYQLNKRWSVSVERDQLGGVSVGGRFHTKF